MFGSLFKRRRRPRNRLSPDGVREVVRHFLEEWPPFRDRYSALGDIAVEWVKNADGAGTWSATNIPAIDVCCNVRVDDQSGEVIEAQLIGMLRRSVVAHWQRSQST